jgi:D-tyrosyl-tRNA(Tyr) deacylase
MRAVLQRVCRASVTFGDERRATDRGAVILIAIGQSDTETIAAWMADKILKLRIFPNEQNKLDKSLLDIRGEILVISQFTLYGDVRYGRRPDFTRAAPPATAEQLYETFVRQIAASGLKTVTGSFGADMLVEIHNDGPVTIIIDSEKDMKKAQ